MKLIMEPNVYLIGKQIIDQNGLNRFLSDENVPNWETDTDIPSQKIVETGGRLCYTSYSKPRPGGNKAYIDHIMEVGHFSVFEHAVWTIIVSGISRSLSHELIRHRHLSPSMLSQRYVDESIGEYVVPPDLQKEVNAALSWSKASVMDMSVMEDEYDESKNVYPPEVLIGNKWLSSVKNSHDEYVNQVNYLSEKAEKNGLIKTEARKFARQAARSVLPNATETKIMLTGNARAFRNVIELRASRHADPEIRVLAIKILDTLSSDSPNLFSDYNKIQLPDGTFEVETKNRKV